MNIRRGLMTQMANDHQFASGSFTGDGTNTVALNVGFEPDVVILTITNDFYTAGWRGAGDIIIVKGRYCMLYYHVSTTSVNPTVNLNAITSATDDVYGASATETYKAYGQYLSGIFTISNTINNINTRFISGTTYNWQAYKMN